MNVFDEIKEVKTRKLASDMPDSFTATVISASKHQGEYGPSLKLELQNQDGTTFSVTYRIPKVLTGKGQLDRLLNSLEELGVPVEQIQGKTFEWQRMELQSAVKGNPRHYPVRLVEK